MKLVLNIIAAFIVLGIWIGSFYFYFLYPETTPKMKIGIVLIVTMILFMNIVYCVGIKFLTKGIVTPKPIDYILTLIFGHFGCLRIRNAFFECTLEKMQANNKQNCENEENKE